MTLSKIRREIGKRLGDLKLQNLRAVVGEYFVEALSNILMDDSFTPTEIPELTAETIESVTLSNGYGEIKLSGILKVYSVTVNPKTSRVMIVRWIDPQYAEKIKVSDVLKPEKDELCVYQQNNILRIIAAKTTVAKFKVTVINIKYPNSSNWGTKDLITDLGYSPRIINNAITGAVNLIRGNSDTK